MEEVIIMEMDLKQVSRDSGLSQTQLAAAAGMSIPTLSSRMKNPMEFTLKEVMCLYKVVGPNTKAALQELTVSVFLK